MRPPQRDSGTVCQRLGTNSTSRPTPASRVRVARESNSMSVTGRRRSSHDGPAGAESAAAGACRARAPIACASSTEARTRTKFTRCEFSARKV